MSTSPCSVKKQHLNTEVFLCYPLRENELKHVLSFLGPQDRTRAQAVCRCWNRYINGRKDYSIIATSPRKQQYQRQEYQSYKQTLPSTVYGEEKPVVRSTLSHFEIEHYLRKGPSPHPISPLRRSISWAIL